MLEFKIVANYEADTLALGEASRAMSQASRDASLDADRRRLAEEGQPPPSPAYGGSGAFPALGGLYTYSWESVAEPHLVDLSLFEGEGEYQKRVAGARAAGKPVGLPLDAGGLLFSRDCLDKRLPASERSLRRHDYFILCRNPQPDEAVYGSHLLGAEAMRTSNDRWGVGIRLNREGGERLSRLTERNAARDGRPGAALAVLVDGEIVTAPTLGGKIAEHAVIEGNFTREAVESIAALLRSGQDRPK